MSLQVDDRVECIEKYDGNDDIVGKEGRVVHKSTLDRVCVQFDEKIVGGHSGPGSKYKSGHCWSIPEDHLKK